MNIGNQMLNLDKILRDDDESDFMPSGGSNLAAIFGSQVKTLESCSSVKQVPKKLNTPRTSIQTVSNKTEVIIAKAVYAFKLQNGTYISIGKLGMALTANVAKKVYQIILYKNKQEPVSVVTVVHDFFYVIQPNNYSSYYDSNKENWTIAFENNDVCTEFAKEIGLARYFSKTGTLESVLYQDLSPTNKDVTAKEGDNVNIKYFITVEITQPLRSNLTAFQTMMVEISTDDNWEKTLLGSSIGLKRLLFLPPNKQISLGPGFPKEKDVLLDIEIVDVQTPEETSHSQKIGSGKASIISRMAKMGQSILPKLPTSATAESEDTESVKRKEDLRFRSKTKVLGSMLIKRRNDVSVTNTACKPFINSSVYTPQWSSTQIQPNFVTLDGQVYSLQQSQAVPSTIPTMIDPGLNMLLSETRMANAELRMGMSKIVENVQKMIDKFHVLELQNATSPIKDKAVLETTLKMLLNMNTSEEKTNQLHKNTNTAVDNCIQLNEMKDEISILEEKLKESEKYTKDLEIQKESLVQINESLSKTIKELEVSLKNSNATFVNAKKNLEEVQKYNGKDEEQSEILENKMLKLSEECSIVEEATSSAEVKENDSKNKEIKHIMNKIYHVLLDKFVDESYSTNYIRTIIASTIKNVTLQVLYNTNENSDMELEAASNRNVETDVLKTDSTELNEVSSVSYIEPPPIPPIDSEDDNN
ncbi:PREDICTED: FK506-binding protein 15-like [Habropoda laboriosa]|nr:PREDICTED: FK506-binding protein 15-like [Habropoda laboriosa]